MSQANHIAKALALRIRHTFTISHLYEVNLWYKLQDNGHIIYGLDGTGTGSRPNNLKEGHGVAKLMNKTISK